MLSAIYYRTQRGQNEIPFYNTGVDNVGAGKQACHGGRFGPPRLWPAVLLSCPFPLWTKPIRGGRVTWEWGVVQLSLCPTLANLAVWRERRFCGTMKVTLARDFFWLMVSVSFLGNRPRQLVLEIVTFYPHEIDLKRVWYSQKQDKTFYQQQD